MSEVTIRAATEDDVEGILRVADRGWRAAYGDFLPEDVIDTAMAEWYDAGATARTLDREDVAYFVADADRRVVGYVSGGPADGTPDEAVLGAIYVDPDRWGEGIGSRLLERFEAWCLDRNRPSIRFRVLAANDLGAAFYRSHGYEVAHEESSELFGEPVTDLCFRGNVDE
ncbi:GNAT family N-acetyltransferase [Natronomonas marina]|uniref:GNAT family N-acetyltransferase n=1 Tax=Natronomonas marina TaxID=2961939 RepID=UPI0020C9435C|nr:GNAT family N-acetyltransferase [Natronomonas marina]